MQSNCHEFAGIAKKIYGVRWLVASKINCALHAGLLGLISRYCGKTASVRCIAWTWRFFVMSTGAVRYARPCSVFFILTLLTCGLLMK